MEKSEIEKALASFESKLKPIQKGKTTLTQASEPEPPEKIMNVPGFPGKKKTEKVIAPPVEVIAPEPALAVAGAEMPCFNKAFKDMIKSLSAEYVGNGLGKPFLVEFMDTQVPECLLGA
jgi:hypothetical protein